VASHMSELGTPEAPLSPPQVMMRGRRAPKSEPSSSPQPSERARYIAVARSPALEALLHEAATPIKELYQLELYAEVQEYGDRTHDAIIELYDTHRKEIERGRRAGSKKAKRALSRYVIETLQGRNLRLISTQHWTVCRCLRRPWRLSFRCAIKHRIGWRFW
jgi:hypothetical protein